MRIRLPRIAGSTMTALLAAGLIGMIAGPPSVAAPPLPAGPDLHDPSPNPTPRVIPEIMASPAATAQDVARIAPVVEQIRTEVVERLLPLVLPKLE
ncbi:MAG: hypothetical protein HY815_12095, partial [Candidatus Riflebacteria bacterium]|nr:hypothetical protein [Candidatus Riflebacteria bacterium]